MGTGAGTGTGVGGIAGVLEPGESVVGVGTFSASSFRDLGSSSAVRDAPARADVPTMMAKVAFDIVAGASRERSRHARRVVEEFIDVFQVTCGEANRRLI
jgi:hypothetical protein